MLVWTENWRSEVLCPMVFNPHPNKNHWYYHLHFYWAHIHKYCTAVGLWDMFTAGISLPLQWLAMILSEGGKEENHSSALVVRQKCSVNPCTCAGCYKWIANVNHKQTAEEAKTEAPQLLSSLLSWLGAPSLLVRDALAFSEAPTISEWSKHVWKTLDLVHNCSCTSDGIPKLFAQIEPLLYCVLSQSNELEIPIHWWCYCYKMQNWYTCTTIPSICTQTVISEGIHSLKTGLLAPMWPISPNYGWWCSTLRHSCPKVINFRWAETGISSCADYCEITVGFLTPISKRSHCF